MIKTRHGDATSTFVQLGQVVLLEDEPTSVRLLGYLGRWTNTSNSIILEPLNVFVRDTERPAETSVSGFPDFSSWFTIRVEYPASLLADEIVEVLDEGSYPADVTLTEVNHFKLTLFIALERDNFPSTTSEGYAERLATRNILVVPGPSFGAEGAGFIRLAMVPTLDDCRAATELWPA